MAGDPPNTEHRVLRFSRGGRPAPAPVTPPAVEDLDKYQRSETPDDYRHRMIVNALGFLFALALIGAGLWIANTMASMRKNQDCVLSGRRGCTPVEFDRNRW
jgi:hypothetical protein